MNVFQTAERSAWAVTKDEVKAQCRIDVGDEDAYLDSLIARAQEDLEQDCDRAFSERALKLTLAAFPSEIHLPFAPLKEITSIKYIDTNGVEQTLSSAAYQVDSDAEPGVVTPAYGQTWPSTRAVHRAVIIEYKAGGWGSTRPLPQAYKDLILATVAHRFENREDSGYPSAVLDAIPNARTWASYESQK